MSHFYDKNGKPAYEVPNKSKGGMRPTTVADARKLNLVPSVTTVMSGAAKPGLDQYLQTQLLNAVETEGTEGDYWRQNVVKKSKEHSSNAANKGTAIHDALEQYYLGNIIPFDMESICIPVIELLNKEFGPLDWRPEVSFAHKLGFGGKIDMSYTGSESIILDFKTKDTDDLKKMIPYDEHGQQTAAYAVGLDIPQAKRYNLFISTQVPGLMNLTESTDFERDWGMFEALLTYWQLKNKYVPGEIT